MNEGIKVKVCGLTSPADASFADSLGADYFGFILHPKSPRNVSLTRFQAMAGELPKRHRVAVAVEPEPGALIAMQGAGFERFQVHFRHDTPLNAIEGWSAEVGPENLWLAPKLPPKVDIPPVWLGLAGSFLLDTFDETLFGGTGRTGDWPKFLRYSLGYPEKTWILSGGLNPANVGDALAGTKARFIDVNSGVESAPGVKDHSKLAAFFAAVRAAAPN
jgi:phosphoribosylanthranilate isomerase